MRRYQPTASCQCAKTLALLWSPVIAVIMCWLMVMMAKPCRAASITPIKIAIYGFHSSPRTACLKKATPLLICPPKLTSMLAKGSNINLPLSRRVAARPIKPFYIKKQRQCLTLTRCVNLSVQLFWNLAPLLAPPII